MRRLPPMGALEAFIIVAQNRTLKAASTELNLSVSALSRRIQSLETYVGTPLFERLHHELRLTADGERLLDHAAPVFDELAQLLTDLRQSGADAGARRAAVLRRRLAAAAARHVQGPLSRHRTQLRFVGDAVRQAGRQPRRGDRLRRNCGGRPLHPR